MLMLINISSLHVLWLGDQLVEGEATVTQWPG